MKKRTNFFTAGLAAICLMAAVVHDVPALAAPHDTELTQDHGSLSAVDLYKNEEFIIVPCCAGASCLDYRVGDKMLNLYTQNRTVNQRWKLEECGDGFIIRTVNADGRVLEVSGGRATDNAQICLGIENGSDAQRWELDLQSDSTYLIRSKLNRNYVLDVKNFSTADTEEIHLYSCHAQNNQLFRITPLRIPKRETEWGASRQDCCGADWSIWNGSADMGWYTQNTKAAAYDIHTAEELAGLARLVNNGTDLAGKQIRLQSDINLCGYEWTPIGNENCYFRGSFLGGGHSIIGLSVTTENDYNGLFGVVSGGMINGFSLSGRVSGAQCTGGVVGWIEKGHLTDIYSEVTLNKGADDWMGGICGYVSFGALVENCTQNARINSGDKEPFRGGIAGYNKGVIRWCVNQQTVDCNWNYVGGITGKNDGGKIEYCANYGEVCGGGASQWMGGIAGYTCNNAVVFGCVNYGYIHSSDDDYIGGIVGDNDANQVWCCINHGDVSGDDHVGGIVGDNSCSNCLNTGHIWGDDEIGAISGDTAYSLEYCRSLSGACERLNGSSDGNGADWVSAEDLRSGKVCWQLNREGKKISYGVEMEHVFYQNVGSDPYPTFAGAAVISSEGENGSYQVTVTSEKGYGTVEGAGEYKHGDAVTLTAYPADGCVFDHYEVIGAVIGSKNMYGGEGDCVITESQSFTEDVLDLTESLDRCYTIRAVFKPYDDTPDDLKQIVRVKLTVTNEVSGWNSEKIPVYLEDSTGERHLWEISRTALDDENESIENVFELGAASPVAVYAYPDFGGGLTVRDYGLKAEIWVNEAGSAMVSPEVTINSYPFMSSQYHDDYMHFAFGNCGSSTVGTFGADGSFKAEGTYRSCSDAWEAANKLGDSAVIRLEGIWLLDRMLELSGGTVTVDLNGYPMIRSIRKTTASGGLLKITNGATLYIIDSDPERRSQTGFTGGSLQGGRSADLGGLIHVSSGCTLDMQGGTLYNGGTDDIGGGAILNQGKATLNHVLISNCWAYGGRSTDNCGGAIRTDKGAETLMTNCCIQACYAQDQAGALMINGGTVRLENVRITGCSAKENEGGAIFMENGGVLDFCEGAVKGCSSDEADGGGMSLRGCTASIQNVVFDNNYAEDNGGAVETAEIGELHLIGCTFTGNTADDNGGAVYYGNSGSRESSIENSVFLNNSSGKNGGGLYVGESHLVLINTELTRNNAGSGSHGGGIYYDNGDLIHGKTMGIQGKMIVRNNKAGSTTDNLFVKYNQLYQDAKITNGGMYEGSEVHLTADGTASYTVFDEISKSQSVYLKADKGSGGLRNERQKEERFVSSVIGEGNVIMLFVGIALFIFGTAAVCLWKN